MSDTNDSIRRGGFDAGGAKVSTGPGTKPAAPPAGPGTGTELDPDDLLGNETGVGGYQPGDIVFSAAADIDAFDDLNVASFDDDFTQLAAFAQAVPYLQAAKMAGVVDVESATSPTLFKPWFHVSIVAAAATASSPASVLGYEDEASQGASVTGLQRAPLSDRHDTVALRPPPGFDVAAMLDAAEGQVDTDYNVAGLLAFAQATQARALAAGPARTELMNLAYGASAVAREISPDAESCVTAVAKAVAAGMDEFLRFAESPVHGPPSDSQMLTVLGGVPASLATIGDLLKILLAGQATPTTSGLDDAVAAATDQASQRFAAPALHDLDTWLASLKIPAGPAPILSITAYLELLTQALEQLSTSPMSGRDLVERGAQRRASGDVLGPDELVASPAMLYDRLIAAGFTRRSGFAGTGV